MTLVTELDLPNFDHTDRSCAASDTARRWPASLGYDGWLAAGPFGFIVLDREPASCSCARRTRCSPA